MVVNIQSLHLKMTGPGLHTSVSYDLLGRAPHICEVYEFCLSVYWSVRS